MIFPFNGAEEIERPCPDTPDQYRKMMTDLEALRLACDAVNEKTEGGCSATPCSLLEWADENLLKAECVTSEIADTGDYDSMWHVEDCDGRKSYGRTLAEAIQDAMKGDDDPTRYDYVPPEFR